MIDLAKLGLRERRAAANTAATLALLLLVGLVQVCSGQTFSALNYLEYPDESAFNQEFHKNVREALLKLDIRQLKDDENLADFLEVVKKVLNNPNTDEKYHLVYEELLSKPYNEKQCSKRMAEVYLSAWTQSKQTSSDLHKYHEFIRKSLRHKFKHCAYIVNESFTEHPLEPDVANDFRELFMATFHLKQDHHSIQDLHEKLVFFDVTKDRFDAKRMVETAKQLDQVKNERPKNDVSFLGAFMLDRCNQLDQEFSRALDIIGLARGYNFELSLFNTRLLLLSEYRRVCLVWKKPNKRALAERNIEKLLTHHRWNKFMSKLSIHNSKHDV